jgi:hypothetical protein
MVKIAISLGVDFQLLLFLGMMSPVLDSPLYFCQSKSPAAMHGVLVWQEFTNAIILQKVVRQSEAEKDFKNVLFSLRQYKLMSDQAKWLQQFQWHSLRQKHGQQLLDRLHDNAFYVFPTHEQEMQHNKEKIRKLNDMHPVTRINAINHGVHAKQCPNDKASGLQPVIFLCKEAKVMLTVNLCVPFGLFNGAIGYVVDILYFNGKATSDIQPDLITVEFPAYTGPPFIQANPKLIPLTPKEMLSDGSCHHCKRKHFIQLYSLQASLA